MLAQLFSNPTDSQLYCILRGADALTDLTVTPVLEGAAGTEYAFAQFWQILPGGMEGFRFVYVTAAIVLPLLLQKGLDKVKLCFQKRRK